jgi:thymidylate synthase (FAD)
MKTKLISITDSLISEQKLSPEELIVYTARVSNPENQLNTETSDKLLYYLIKHKHWSPFEMVDMTVEITTSRAIAQQILRHRSFSFQEFSQRYSKATKFESIDLRYKGKTNRQSSESLVDFEDHLYFGQQIENLITQVNKLYNEMIDNDIAKECARMILPLATQTTLYMKGSVRSWIHYLQIRTDEHTQLEHREIADEIKNIFIEKFPNISKALNF